MARNASPAQALVLMSLVEAGGDNYVTQSGSLYWDGSRISWRTWLALERAGWITIGPDTGEWLRDLWITETGRMQAELATQAMERRRNERLERFRARQAKQDSTQSAEWEG